MIRTASKLNRTLIAAAAILIASTTGGCTSDDPGTAPQSPGAGNHAAFRITVPGMRTPSTPSRALDAEKETELTEIAVVVFDNASNAILEYHRIAAADISISADADADYEFNLKALANTSNITAALIANAGVEVVEALDAAASGGSYVGTPKADFLAALQTVNGAKWNTSSTGYWTIPMYGEVAVTGSVYAAGTLPVAGLTRMLAKVDVINNVAPADTGNPQEGDFELLAVHVVNRNTRGAVAPQWNPATGLLTGGTPSAANLPADPATRLWSDGNELTYTPSGDATGILDEIYLFESNALYDPAENPAVANPGVASGGLRLVVEGLWTSDGQTRSYFYPVDFTGPQSAGQTRYIPVLRNHRYVVTLTSAEGRGYTSLGDAAASYGVESNLKTRLISYDESVIRDMVFDGQYVLGVDEKMPVVTREKQDVAVELFADNPSGWTATLDDPAVNDWLRFADGTIATSGNPELTKFTLSVGAFAPAAGDAQSRTATITLVSGRLRLGVSVTQNTDTNLSLRITDARGNDVSELVFGHGLTSAIAAQRVFVTWNGADGCAVTQEAGTDGNTAFAYDTRSDMPAGSAATVTSPVAIAGSGKMYEIRAAESDNYTVTRQSSVTFTMTDDRGNAISRSLALRQAEPVTETPVSASTYVGAFWRAGQTGERVIRIPVAAANVGGWGVRVLDYGGFSEGDIVFDKTAYDTYPLTGDAEDAANAVTGGARAYGAVETTDGYLSFRIGLAPTATLASATAAPRYAVVAIYHTLNDATCVQKLYLRQGEAPDYVMAPGDKEADGAEFAGGRPDARRWSPFNLTAKTWADVGGANVTQEFVQINKRTASGTPFYETGTTYGTDEPDFAAYPTMGGAHFQWAQNTDATGQLWQRRAFNPGTPAAVTGWSSNYRNSSSWTWDDELHETCPQGYRRPDIKIQADGVAGNEAWQSFLSTQANISANSAWGYYADGYFDRLEVEMTEGMSANTTNASVVARGGKDAAYMGRILFNNSPSSATHYNASLFVPAAGARSYISGALLLAGTYGYGWSRLVNSSSSSYGCSYAVISGDLDPYNYGTKSNGFAVRCVVADTP